MSKDGKFIFLSLILCIFALTSFGQKKSNGGGSNELAIKWARTTLDFINMQPSKSPTFISRCLGYMGLGMYESVVYSSKRCQSVASQLNGLVGLSKPAVGLVYDWETVLNANQANLVKSIWQPQKQPNGNFLVKEIDSLENATLLVRYAVVKDTAIIRRSIDYGILLANEIFQWSFRDGGHEMNFLNFDPMYRFPTGPHLWNPPLNGQSNILLPLHPHWGKNRQFLKSNADLAVPEIIPFSKDTSSGYYKQFKMVYDIQKNLSQEQKEIANWWGDDPAFTVAPPGHSYNLAIIVNTHKKSDLVTAAMSFARVGMACADAFINCWRCKYKYHSERPYNYIRRVIDPKFVQYWPEPPFPAFPSGHSMQASAAAEVLIDVFGDKLIFVDTSHQGRKRDELRKVEYKNRKFSRISETALECGISRLYGGIHTEQDNRVGLDEGVKIGRNINRLAWQK
jgi:hypothetical protein